MRQLRMKTYTDFVLAETTTFISNHTDKADAGC